MCDRAGAFTLAFFSILVGVALPAAADPLAQKALPSLSAPVELTAPVEIRTPIELVAPAVPEVALPVGSAAETALPAEAADSAEAAAALGTPEILPPRTEPMERSERSRVLSYIILQGLQGIGPFAGAR